MVSFKSIRWALYSILLFTLILIGSYKFLVESWMQYKLRHEHIVVSLSTTPYRINTLQESLHTIFQQNAPIKMIYLSVPYVFKRDNIKYSIPQWLLEHPKITVLRTDDYGPATKLLGVLKHVELPEDAIIVTLDDDVLYPRNAVLHLAYAAYKDNAAFGYGGANLDYDEQEILKDNDSEGLIMVLEDQAKVDAVRGFAGIAYKRQFFQDDIYRIVELPNECVNSDDLVLSFYLTSRHIDKKVVANRFVDRSRINYHTDQGFARDALHKLYPTPLEKHRACVAYLRNNGAWLSLN